MKGKELLSKTGSWLRMPIAHRWFEMLGRSYKSFKAGKVIQGTLWHKKKKNQSVFFKTEDGEKHKYMNRV